MFGNLFTNRLQSFQFPTYLQGEILTVIYPGAFSKIFLIFYVYLRFNNYATLNDLIQIGQLAYQ